MNKQKDDLGSVIDRYSDCLYKICFLILKNEHDTKDVLQETFLAYYTKSPEFTSEEHKKAWLIKVSQNKCREFLRFHKKHACLPLNEIDESFMMIDGLHHEERELLSLILNMDYKRKSVFILYYIEGYSVEETAQLLRISVSAVKKRLQRAREALRSDYKGEVTYE